LKKCRYYVLVGSLVGFLKTPFEDVKTKFKQILNVEENTCLVNFFLQNMTKVADCGIFFVSFLQKYLFKLSIPIIFVAERVGKKVQP